MKKKFIAPFVLFVLVLALVIYLASDFSGTRSIANADAYLAARARIDSLELALWNTRATPDAQVEIRMQLDSAWEVISSMRSAPEVDSEDVATVGGVPLSFETVKWVVGGIAAVALCVFVLILVLRKRKEYITRRMEAIKAERFKEPALDEATIPPRPRPRREKRSIIADAEAYAARKRETLENQVSTPLVPPQAAPHVVAQAASQAESVSAAASAEESVQEAPKVVFEDENGIPENKILTAPDGKPTLRPTAKERITSAMQNLSDVLRAPRGLSRERTMKLRAQSRNLTGNPSLQKSPLEITRFDRESSEKNKILQMSRRGFPASAIASSLKISQDKVEAVIKEAMG